MENIDEQLKISICSILNPVSEDTVTDIIEAIKHAGLESLSDLEYVQEEDLILVLKPIQRRKLIKAWSEQTFHPAEGSNNLSIPNCMWTEGNNLLLLQVYSKYKSEFSCSDLDLNVWSKIADEVQAKTSLDCDKFQCLKQIDELRLEYEKCKKHDAASWTQVQLTFIKHAREVFETSQIKREDDDKGTVNKIKVDVPSKVCFVSPTVSVPSVTINESAAPITPSTAIADTAHSDGSGDKKNFKDEITVPATEISNNIPLGQCKWTRLRTIKLLQVYTKYRREFAHLGADRLIMWSKIAVEVNGISPKFYCDGLQCCKKIEEIKLEYDRIDIQNITNRKIGDIFDKAKIAFETTENLAQFSTQQQGSLKLNDCGKTNKDYHLTLLRVYAKYKLEFLLPGADERRVWEKIAKEMREVFSYDCGEFLCRADMFQMLQRYRTLTPTSKNIPYYFHEAQQAFGTHNLGIFPFINHGYYLHSYN